jgi:hypothetical protein
MLNAHDHRFGNTPSSVDPVGLPIAKVDSVSNERSAFRPTLEGGFGSEGAFRAGFMPVRMQGCLLPKSV